MAESKVKKSVQKTTEVKKAAPKAAVKTTKPAKKAEVKEVKKQAEVKVSPRKSSVQADSKVSKSSSKSSGQANSNYKASVLSVAGEAKGNLSLPSDIFGITPNRKLINQAIRVYLANQRQGTSSTKTRSEVVGSTRKIYRQKGTGRARHGALKAPLFVGGGIAFGPKPRDFSLKLPQKMRKIALFSALSEKAQEGSIRVIDGDFTGKTSEFSKFFKKTQLLDKRGKAKRVLLVINNDKKAKMGAKNFAGVEVEEVSNLNTYGVVINKDIFFMKNAIEEISKKYTK